MLPQHRSLNNITSLIQFGSFSFNLEKINQSKTSFRYSVTLFPIKTLVILLFVHLEVWECVPHGPTCGHSLSRCCNLKPTAKPHRPHTQTTFVFLGGNPKHFNLPSNPWGCYGNTFIKGVLSRGGGVKKVRLRSRLAGMVGVDFHNVGLRLGLLRA